MKDKREENKLEGHEQPTEIELKKEYLREYEKAVRQMERSELKMQEIRLNKICPSVIIDGMPHASNHIRKKKDIWNIDIRESKSARR